MKPALKSTTADVVSVSARPEGDRIVYSICDEYDTEFEVSPATSKQSLSLEELIGLIDHAGFKESLGIDFTLMNYPVAQSTPEKLARARDFTTVCSVFYPQVTLQYEKLVRWWYEERPTT